MDGELIPKLEKLTYSFITREFQPRKWARGLHFIWWNYHEIWLESCLFIWKING